MKLVQVKNLACNLMNENGLDINKWGFNFNNRKRAIGVCFFNTYEKNRIELSRHFAELNDFSIISQVILHEIAHAIAGHEVGHGRKWQVIARRIGVKNPSPYADGAIMEYKYRYKCDKCSYLKGGRHRKPKRDILGTHKGCGGLVTIEKVNNLEVLESDKVKRDSLSYNGDL